MKKPWKKKGLSDIEVLKNPRLRSKYWKYIDDLVSG